MTTVGELLDKKGHMVYSVASDCPIVDALKVMGEKSAGVILIIDKGQLKGVVSERDIIRKILIKKQCELLSSKVSAIMTKKVVFVRPEQSIEDCMGLMTNERIRHLPVLEDKEVVGVVSIGDLVKFLLNEKEQLISHYEKYIYEG